MRISNARVSTQDQHSELQLYMLVGASCEQVFQEKMSGKDRGVVSLSNHGGHRLPSLFTERYGTIRKSDCKGGHSLKCSVFALYLSRAKD